MLTRIVILPLLFLAACGAEPATPPFTHGHKDSCTELGRLLDQLDRLDSLLYADARWKACTTLLEQSLPLLEKHVRGSDSLNTCHYLDQRNFPDRPRLLFVETLRNRIEEDTLPEGMKYLLRLRGTFSEDPTLAEWFSEELAHIALRNPACYARYLRKHPDQEIMLTYSPKWRTSDLDSLIARFDRHPGTDSLVDHLRELRLNDETGI